YALHQSGIHSRSTVPRRLVIGSPCTNPRLARHLSGHPVQIAIDKPAFFPKILYKARAASNRRSASSSASNPTKPTGRPPDGGPRRLVIGSPCTNPRLARHLSGHPVQIAIDKPAFFPKILYKARAASNRRSASSSASNATKPTGGPPEGGPPSGSTAVCGASADGRGRGHCRW